MILKYISFIVGVKGAQVEEIYDLSKPFRGYVKESLYHHFAE